MTANEQWRHDMRLGSKAGPYNKTCGECGEEFVSKQMATLYCSDECKKVSQRRAKNLRARNAYHADKETE